MGNPVRKIGINTRSMTGKMPTGDAYESSLERDFMTLINFDHRVNLFTPQPVKIRYTSADGQPRTYTPDGLVEWRTDIEVYDGRPLLVEVKYRRDLSGNFYDLLGKFRAAHLFAQEQGWVFEVFTEDRIRTPLLDNIRFLTRYKAHYDAEDILKISNVLDSNPSTNFTINELLNLLDKDPWGKATLLTSIWTMIAKHELGCDLSQPITMSSDIWRI